MRESDFTAAVHHCPSLLAFFQCYQLHLMAFISCDQSPSKSIFGGEDCATIFKPFFLIKYLAMHTLRLAVFRAAVGHSASSLSVSVVL